MYQIYTLKSFVACKYILVINMFWYLCHQNDELGNFSISGNKNVHFFKSGKCHNLKMSEFLQNWKVSVDENVRIFTKSENGRNWKCQIPSKTENLRIWKCPNPLKTENVGIWKCQNPSEPENDQIPLNVRNRLQPVLIQNWCTKFLSSK